MFHKVVWQHMPGVVGILITILLQLYWRIRLSACERVENRLRFDRDATITMMSTFYGTWCIY